MNGHVLRFKVSSTEEDSAVSAWALSLPFTLSAWHTAQGVFSELAQLLSAEPFSPTHSQDPAQRFPALRSLPKGLELSPGPPGPTHSFSPLLSHFETGPKHLSKCLLLYQPMGP